MYPQPASAGAAVRRLPLSRRRRPTLLELVRDLAGWTLPASPASVSHPADGWAMAWASC